MPEDAADVSEEPVEVPTEEAVAVDGASSEEATVTVWSPEPTGADDVVTASVEEWIASVDFESTADVPIPDRLVDQVIGQEAGSVVIKKAAEQRRHMLMIGDPGTGKSMLAKSMTDLLPKDALEDVLVYPNEDDENVPLYAPFLQDEQSASSRCRRKPFANSGKNPNECSSSPSLLSGSCC